MEYPPLGASFLRVSRVAVQIERNQVVFLIVRRCLVHVAGRAELLLLEIVRVAGRFMTASSEVLDSRAQIAAITDRAGLDRPPDRARPLAHPWTSRGGR
jgi:hypothetical protein